MLEALNPQTFSPFGRLLEPGQGFPAPEGWQEELRSYRSDNLHYLQAQSELYLAPGSGTPTLWLRQEGATRCFYLDRALCLPGGSEFALVPYQLHCGVRLCWQEKHPPKTLESFPRPEGLSPGSALRLGPIYDLQYRQVEPGFLFKGESHPMHELICLTRGRLHCVVDGEGTVLQPGQLLIFDPDQWHMHYTDMDSGARFLNVTFFLESDLRLPPSGWVFPLSGEEIALLQRMIRERELEDEFSGDAIRSTLKLLLLSLLRQKRPEQSPESLPKALCKENHTVRCALQYIARHVEQKLSVEQLAQQIGVSASHLTALFHRQLSISPGEYIRRVKLEESRALIREGSLNFSQIAARLGYSTIHHFSRQFKDNFGITPSEYARSVRTD